MTRRRIFLAVAWALSLIIVAAIVHAQTPAQSSATPTVISGSDLGFRVERRRSDRIAGTLVVRINGEWVPAEFVERLKY
jgi:hypothetical protein